MRCQDGGPLHFKGQIEKLDYLDERVLIDGEFAIAVAVAVNIKNIDIYDRMDCSGNLASLKLTETGRGYLSKGNTYYFYIDDTSKLESVPFGSWSYKK